MVQSSYYDPIAGLYYDYPTGTNAVTGCVAPGADTGNSANCNGALNALTDIGAYALSDSPNGTFDQGGNVYEWHEQIKFGSARGLRGGSWYFDPVILAAGYSIFDGPTGEYDKVGFRVASIPEPSTALLVLTGLGSLALRHRRRG